MLPNDDRSIATSLSGLSKRYLDSGIHPRDASIALPRFGDGFAALLGGEFRGFALVETLKTIHAVAFESEDREPNDRSDNSDRIRIRQPVPEMIDEKSASETDRAPDQKEADRSHRMRLCCKRELLINLALGWPSESKHAPKKKHGQRSGEIPSFAPILQAITPIGIDKRKIGTK